MSTSGEPPELKCEPNRHGYASRRNVVANVCPIRYVMIPTYVRGATPELTRISRAEAAFALHRVCFNLLQCERVGLDVIAGIVRNADCYRLTAGDLGSTVRLLDSLVSGSSHETAEVSVRRAAHEPIANATRLAS